MLEKLVKVLNMTNPSAVIAQYVDKLKVLGRKVSAGKIKCINKAEKILVSIIQIQKFFPKGRSKRAGGIAFTNFY